MDKVKRILNFDIAAADGDKAVVSLNETIILPVDKDIVRLVAPEKQTLTRKRKSNPQTWNKNRRKQLRETGHEYVDKRGKIHAAKTVKGSCLLTCHLKCSEHFSQADRKKIRDIFYSLSDSKKNQFYEKYTERYGADRKRTENAISRRQYTFSYFFECNGILRKVCKKFFCGTLDISHKRIYYFHAMCKTPIGLARSPTKGKSGHKSTSVEKLEEIKEHINSFPRIESHYCRSSSKREYLDSLLSIRKMFDMYKMVYSEPVKENIYRKVFNEQFNLCFHQPKKDVCDLCSEFKMIANPTAVKQMQYGDHLKRKEIGNEERNKDRNIRENSTAIVIFDLENVFSLPKANVSCFFYKSK